MRPSGDNSSRELNVLWLAQPIGTNSLKYFQYLLRIYSSKFTSGPFGGNQIGQPKLRTERLGIDPHAYGLTKIFREFEVHLARFAGSIRHFDNVRSLRSADVCEFQTHLQHASAVAGRC